VDLHSLSLDLRAGLACVRAVDADGEQTVALDGEAYARVLAAAQPLFSWAQGRVPPSARTPRDSTLLAFEIDAMARSLRLAFVAEQAKKAEPASGRTPALSWCSSDYDAHHPLLREAARAALRELRPRPAESAAGALDPELRWERIYQDGGDGWELGRAAPPLGRYLAETSGVLPAGGRALVIGCGRGNDALLLSRLAQKLGVKVVAIDIAPTAVSITNRTAATAGLGDCLRAYRADLFTPAADASDDLPLYSGGYDLVLEHTCYCAIAPVRRDEYVATVARLLKPGGRLVGLFYCHDYPGGPPYAATADEIRGRLAESFLFEHEEVPPDSVLTRAGVEWLVCARRNP
jgi:thiopurine S-methyltransferase